VKALKALLSVVILLVQKLINKKEVTPIISHPNNNVIQFAANNNKSIDKTKAFNSAKKLITLISNLM
jgi:hypothetical protein